MPWNYPLFLCTSPLIGAVAAGNRCMIEMATNSSHLSLLMQYLFAQNLPADLISILHGADGSEFSALPFDHLIFSGSIHTGQQIMWVAADNLTPVTLGLGGKSPTIIAPDYSIIKVAQRLLFSKCLNAGQTCVAHDYLIGPEVRVDEFIVAAQTIVSSHYRDIESADYTSIINDSAFTHLQSVLAEAVNLGAASIPLLPNSAANPASRTFPYIIDRGG